jgi:universal stress protein A
MKGETTKPTRKSARWLVSNEEVLVTNRRSTPIRALSLKTIIVPIDFSPPLDECAEVRVQAGGPVRSGNPVGPCGRARAILNDLPNVALVRSDQEIARQAKLNLQAIAQDKIEELVPVYPEVRTGKAYDEIVAAAKVSGADLIVIATHGYTGLKYAFLGSTAERVVRHAHCPVLVVRQPGKE